MDRKELYSEISTEARFSVSWQYLLFLFLQESDAKSIIIITTTIRTVALRLRKSNYFPCIIKAHGVSGQTGYLPPKGVENPYPVLTE